jgi:hypothetical protein
VKEGIIDTTLRITSTINGGINSGVGNRIDSGINSGVGNRIDSGINHDLVSWGIGSAQ